MDFENNENSSEHEGMISEDNETGLDNNWRFKEGIRNYSVPTKWAAPHERDYPRPRSPDIWTKISLPSNAEAPQPVTDANTENLRSDPPRRREEGLEPPRRRRD